MLARISVVATLAVLSFAAPAAASDWLTVTFTSPHGSATAKIVAGSSNPICAGDPQTTPCPGPVSGSGCLEVFRLTDGGCGGTDPAITAGPGETVTIAADLPVESLTAAIEGLVWPHEDTWQRQELVPVATGPGTWVVTMPAVVPEHNALTVSADYRLPDVVRQSYHGARLDVPATAAVPVPVAAPAAGVALAELPRVASKRVRVTVACPASAGPCGGTVTIRSKRKVRSRKLVLARIPFSGVAAGQGKTVSAVVPASVRRSLRRHPGLKLQAVVRANGT